jgi:hypothetical protein
MQRLLDALTQQRIPVACAVLVCLLLTVWGQAPVLPVVAGCVLAVGIAVLRAKPTFPGTKSGQK